VFAHAHRFGVLKQRDFKSLLFNILWGRAISTVQLDVWLGQAAVRGSGLVFLISVEVTIWNVI